MAQFKGERDQVDHLSVNPRRPRGGLISAGLVLLVLGAIRAATGSASTAVPLLAIGAAGVALAFKSTGPSTTDWNTRGVLARAFGLWVALAALCGYFIDRTIALGQAGPHHSGPRAAVTMAAAATMLVGLGAVSLGLTRTLRRYRRGE